MSKRRVMITGLGMLSPLGVTVEETWKNILAGKSGVSRVSAFNTTEYPVQIAAQVPAFDLDAYIPIKDQKKMDISLQYGFVAAMQAWKDSGIELTDMLRERTGVAIGSGIGGLSTIEETCQILFDKGPKRISPFFIPASIINMISGYVSIELGLKGPNISIVTACTTGTHNIGMAARMIAYGDADVMVAGGAEKASCALGLGGFAAARALSKRNEAPEEASRPWDKDRDGFVLGDGAGVLVLEEYEHAKARGAKIYAEIIGFGMSADAYHMTLPDGIGAYRAMNNALKDAGLSPAQVNYINAHGTSTPAGDVMESQACERLLGEAALKVPVSSTKSMIGHLLGAAGAVESIFSILAIRDNVVPPTINLHNAEEGCRLDYVPNEARSHQVNVSMNNSFGFGGTNGTVIFKRV
jgi:3-oxoacyl-[acyl-carrier-protein] synthase II